MHFAAAVDKDKATLNNGSVKFDNTVSLKEKIFKKLLQQTNSFKNFNLLNNFVSPEGTDLISKGEASMSSPFYLCSD